MLLSRRGVAGSKIVLFYTLYLSDLIGSIEGRR